MNDGIDLTKLSSDIDLTKLSNEERERVQACIKACRGVQTGRLITGILWNMLKIFDKKNVEAIERLRKNWQRR